MKIFFDTKFTGLHAKTSLISIGWIAENGRTFHAEFNDFDKSHFESIDGNVTTRNRKEVIVAELQEWLESFNETVFIMSDCLAYDRGLFCDLWGVMSKAFCGMDGAKHNALHDAKVMRLCHDKLMTL